MSAATSAIRGNAAMFVRGEEHARVTRMRREGEHPAAELGDASDASKRAEIGEQLLGACERLRLGRFEPAKRRHIVDPARLQSEHDFGEIEALHLRQFLRGAVEMLALGPEPQATARGGAPARPAR